MTMDERETLAERVAEFLDRLEHEPGLTPEAFAAAHAPLSEQLLRAIQGAQRVQALLGSATPGTPERIGPYRVIALLGRGGMGVVYTVEREGRRFALKLLAQGLATAPRALERFQREARGLARLAHPGIVRIHDTGIFQGSPYLVMDLVEGPTLAELELPLTPERAARIVRALALAVEAAHSAGVLHRDLKPSNVILRADDSPVLLDFGLVAAEDENTLTTSGALLGTPRYMAPEQAAGLPAERRTDVHGLGLILYELLHGEYARREGSRAEVLARVRRGRVHRPRSRRAPRELEHVIRCALAREPHRRPSSAALLAEDLGRFLASEPVRLRAPRIHQRCLDTLRRHPLRVVGGVAGLGLLVLGARLALFAPRFPTEARDAHLDAALCAWMQGSEPLARVELEHARALDREHGVAAALAAAWWGAGPVPPEPEWIARGLVALRNGDASAAAIALAEPARRSAPAAALLARALAQSGAGECALEEARAGVARFPGSSALVAELARLLAERGEATQALALLRATSERFADEAPLLAAHARLALAAGEHDEAVEVALHAAERFGVSGGDASAELPRLLALAESTEATRAALRRRIASGGERALLVFALAYALDSDHQLAQAAAAYARALELEPRLLRAHLNLAHLHAGAQLGACLACERAFAEAPAVLAPERALEHLRAALQLDRGEDEACVGRVIQTTLVLGTRAPEAGAFVMLGATLRDLLGQPDLSAGARRRLEEGLARLNRAGGG